VRAAATILLPAALLCTAAPVHVFPMLMMLPVLDHVVPESSYVQRVFPEPPMMETLVPPAIHEPKRWLLPAEKEV
jgi:hypothetical protein